MDRLQELASWLSTRFPDSAPDIVPASSDASFRRYFRVTIGGVPRIVMDAPPDKEDCTPYLHVARLFHDAGVHVPEVLAEDRERGFLLLSDLGATTYLAALRDEAAAHALYVDAIDALIRIQRASRAGVLPDYDERLLMREMRLFQEWYVPRHLSRELPPVFADLMEEQMALVLANNLRQPRVFVHRDYHSRNLMVTDPNPGILDFQDAVYGPVTYDLVSLFRDAYIRWDEELVLDWTIRYWETARKAGLPVDRDFAAFYRDFEWMGVQRHLKVLGIFARLYHRDGKDGYLKDIPLVREYLEKTVRRYRELHDLARVLDYLHDAEVKAGFTF